MHKLLAAAAALALMTSMTSAALAACEYHNRTAQSTQPAESVAMSTYDGAALPPVVAEEEQAPVAATTTICADGEEDCKPATK